MATRKAKPKAKAARKSPAKRKAATKGVAALKIGNFSLDDVLKSTSKNVDALADANRAIIDGYTDIAKRQYEMLKELLRELTKVRGDRDVVVKDLKRLSEHAKRDVQALQKMAKKANSKAQQIVKKRAEANIKAWKKLVDEARKSVGGKAPAAKKSAPKKKVAAKKKAAPKKKAAARKRPAAKKKAS